MRAAYISYIVQQMQRIFTNFFLTMPGWNLQARGSFIHSEKCLFKWNNKIYLIYHWKKQIFCFIKETFI